jgi:hypothetical protein
LELLLFDQSQSGPDGDAIGVTVLADFLDNCCDVAGCLSICFGNGSADELKAFEMGGGVKLCGRLGLLVAF